VDRLGREVAASLSELPRRLFAGAVCKCGPKLVQRSPGRGSARGRSPTFPCATPAVPSGASDVGGYECWNFGARRQFLPTIRGLRISSHARTVRGPNLARLGFRPVTIAPRSGNWSGVDEWPERAVAWARSCWWSRRPVLPDRGVPQAACPGCAGPSGESAPSESHDLRFCRTKRARLDAVLGAGPERRAAGTMRPVRAGLRSPAAAIDIVWPRADPPETAGYMRRRSGPKAPAVWSTSPRTLQPVV